MSSPILEPSIITAHVDFHRADENDDKEPAYDTISEYAELDLDSVHYVNVEKKTSLKKETNSELPTEHSEEHLYENEAKVRQSLRKNKGCPSKRLGFETDD
jgi:hypothetical protein